MPDQPAFRLLQQGWNEFASGAYTKAQMLRILTKRGLRLRSGKPLTNQIVDHLFADAFYAGVIRDPWSGEEYAGRHMAMVSRETFDAVQRVIAGRSRSLPHHELRPEFPLRSFVRCGNCESTLTGSFSRGRSAIYPYYHCYSRDCDSHGNYPLGDVHEEYLTFLHAMSANRHALAHLHDWIQKIAKSWDAEQTTITEKRAAERWRVETERQQLIRMKMENLITDDEFRTQRRILAERLSQCGEGNPKLAGSPDSVLRDLATICKPLTHLADTWKAVPIKFQRRFQHITLPTGYVFGRVGTAQRGRLLSFFRSPLPVDTNVVPLAGESWNQLMEEIKALAMIFNECSIQ